MMPSQKNSVSEPSLQSFEERELVNLSRREGAGGGANVADLGIEC